MSISRNRLSD